MKSSLILLVAVLTLLSLSGLVESKVVNQSIPYSKLKKNGHQIYFTRFSQDIGTGWIKAKVKLNKPLFQVDPEQKTQLILAIVADDRWEEYQLLDTCKEKINALRSQRDMWVPNDGKGWSEVVEIAMQQVYRRRSYFFMLMDCEDRFKGTAPSNLKIEIEAEITNVDGNHFASEEDGFLIPFFLLFAICTGFFARNLKRIIKQYKQEEELDWAFLLANITLLLQALDIFLEWVHMLIYSSNGKGSFVLQLFGQLFGITSQFTMACIFILISWGWTINYTDLENYDIYIPLGVLLGIVHMMIMGLSKLTDDESNKFHQFGGVPGWIIVILRVCMYIYFLFGIRDTLKTAREKVKTFIIQFTVFGTAFFLALPVILFISTFIADYVQLRVVTIGTITIQSTAMIIMSYLFTSKSSGYYQASVKSNPLLPTGKSD